MRALRVPVFLLCIFAAVVAVSVAQSEGDGRGVVQASEILEKIERGESVDFDGKIIVGDIKIGDLRLPEVHIARGYQEIDSLGLSENLKVILSRIYLDNPFGTAIEAPNMTLKVILSRIYLDNCSIKGDLDLSNALMLGEVAFIDCTISSEANFLGSQFNQSALFINTQFNHSANFRKTQFSQGAGFFYAQFNQSADFEESQFNQNANFMDAKFNQDANFRAAQFNQLAYFVNATFEKDGLFEWSYIKSAEFDEAKFSGDLSLKGTQIDSLSLTDSEIHEIDLRSWKSIGHMEYDEMAYQLLLSNFRNRNLPDDANECYYDYRQDRRATLSTLRQPADYALMLFYGYGVKPERPVIWAFVFMAIFGALFWWRQGIMPVREGEPEEEANRFTLPEALAFSAMTFLSGGKLVFDPPEYRIAPGKPWRDVQICKALFVWERLMGMMLLFMFAVAVTKTIILGS